MSPMKARLTLLMQEWFSIEAWGQTPPLKRVPGLLVLSWAVGMWAPREEEGLAKLFRAIIFAMWNLVTPPGEEIWLAWMSFCVGCLGRKRGGGGGSYLRVYHWLAVDGGCRDGFEFVAVEVGYGFCQGWVLVQLFDDRGCDGYLTSSGDCANVGVDVEGVAPFGLGRVFDCICESFLAEEKIAELD